MDSSADYWTEGDFTTAIANSAAKAAIPAFSESPTSHPKAMETKLRRIGRDTAKWQRAWVKGQRVRTTDRQRRVGGADRSNRASRCGLLSTAHESILSRFSPLTST